MAQLQHILIQLATLMDQNLGGLVRTYIGAARINVQPPS